MKRHDIITGLLLAMLLVGTKATIDASSTSKCASYDLPAERYAFGCETIHALEVGLVIMIAVIMAWIVAREENRKEA